MANGRLITIGSFDGVHRGHSTLIEWTVREAKSRGLTPTALTFEIPPRMVLDLSRPITVLSTPIEKEFLLRRSGLADVISLPFDRHFSQTRPFSFFRDTLLNKLKTQGIVVGLDFRFGMNRSAGATELVRWGVESGIPVWVIPKVAWKGRVVSSSFIRESLMKGRHRTAEDFLGHPYLIAGSIRSGRGVGRKIGFPTTNLLISKGKLLPGGVFVVSGRFVSSANKAWWDKPGVLGVCNIGRRPTFLKNSPTVVEIHWLGAAKIPKRGMVVLELLHHLRAEKKFKSATDLQSAIRRDVARAHAVWSVKAKNQADFSPGKTL